MADTYPEIPFRNALSGPAGEYSAAYQKIVQQYRDDVDSATRLRAQQELERGIPQLQPSPRLIHKSGNDIVGINPTTGQADLIYRAPAAPQRPMAPPKPSNPYVDPREMEMMRSARDTLKLAEKRFATLEADPNANNNDLMAAQLDLKDARDALGGFVPAPSVIPPLNPQPALTAPQTATASAPTYTPAPMMDAGEIPPLGSIIMGRRNTLAAPPSTTQATPRRFRYENGKLIAQ